MKTALLSLMLASSGAWLCACGKSATTDNENMANATGDAMASLDETSQGGGIARLDLPSVRPPAFLQRGPGQQVLDLLFPKAYADSCWLEAFSGCSSGVRTRTFSDCTIGPLTLSGTVSLTFSDSACGFSAAGDTVTRTGDFAITGESGASLAVTSPGGGQLLTDTGVGYTYAVPGMERIGTASDGSKLFDVSTATTADLQITGSSRATRVVTGGTLVVTNNLASYAATLTPTALGWSATCNCPVSGSLSGSLSGSRTGTFDLSLTGCGTATLTVDGLKEDIVLDRCGGI